MQITFLAPASRAATRLLPVEGDPARRQEVLHPPLAQGQWRDRRVVLAPRRPAALRHAQAVRRDRPAPLKGRPLEPPASARPTARPCAEVIGPRAGGDVVGRGLQHGLLISETRSRPEPVGGVDYEPEGNRVRTLPMPPSTACTGSPPLSQRLDFGQGQPFDYADCEHLVPPALAGFGHKRSQRHFLAPIAQRSMPPLLRAGGVGVEAP